MLWMFLWDDGEGGNVEHVAEHGLTTEDVEEAFDDVLRFTTSRSTGRPALFGQTTDERTLFVVYELETDDDGDEYVYVRTAYEIPKDTQP